MTSKINPSGTNTDFLKPNINNDRLGITELFSITANTVDRFSKEIIKLQEQLL